MCGHVLMNGRGKRNHHDRISFFVFVPFHRVKRQLLALDFYLEDRWAALRTRFLHARASDFVQARLSIIPQEIVIRQILPSADPLLVLRQKENRNNE